MPLVLTLGTPFRENFLLKPGPMGRVRLLATPAKAKTTELLCKGPRGLKGHSFGGSGRAWEGPVGWAGPREGGRKGRAPLHLCCCCHCRPGIPASPGRSPTGRRPRILLRQPLERGCVGLSPRLPLSLGAGAGPLLEKRHVRNVCVSGHLGATAASSPALHCSSRLCAHLPSVRSSQLQEATRLARQPPRAQEGSASSSLSL